MAPKTTKKFKHNTSAFTIAHYILLFLVTGLCISIIAWIIITRNGHTQSPQNIIHIKSTDPCVQRINEIVTKMWTLNPDAIPQKYWEIANNYLNQTITTRTYGICEDVAYTCHVGQIMRDCNPCAVPAARNHAIEIQISDLINANCAPAPQQN